MNNQSECIYDACVIGAGASGLVAATVLASRGFHTILIEQNKKSGRKLYATGNGRCNLANAVLSDSAYYNNSFAMSVVSKESVKEMLAWLEGIGIPLTDRQGYLYPQSMQASSVVWALTDAARLAGVEFLYECRVEDVGTKEGTGGPVYTVRCAGKQEIRITSSRLVLALGSPAAQELGAAKDRDIYRILEGLEIPYALFQPALCPVETEEDLSALAGVRARCTLSLDRTEQEPTRTSEEGEIQFTDYGISGIVTFNLSTLAKEGDRFRINLLPEWKDAGAVAGFLEQVSGERSLYGALNGLLHEKICLHGIRKFYPEDTKRKLSACTREELLRIAEYLMAFPITVKKLLGAQGQAGRGGILTDSVDPATMQIRNTKGLAVTGELTEVTGRCGGYNLMYAVISALRAGNSL